MAVGRRMLGFFARRPGLLHAVITGWRPAWRAFTDVTRGTSTLGGMVRDSALARAPSTRWTAARPRSGPYRTRSTRSRPR